MSESKEYGPISMAIIEQCDWPVMANMTEINTGPFFSVRKYCAIYSGGIFIICVLYESYQRLAGANQKNCFCSVDHIYGLYTLSCQKEIRQTC